MALAVNGSGTLFKKCDRANHRPDSNKGCASSTCQHTCDHPEHCDDAWTLRYWVNGKQVKRCGRSPARPGCGYTGILAADSASKSRWQPTPRF